MPSNVSNVEHIVRGLLQVAHIPSLVGSDYTKVQSVVSSLAPYMDADVADEMEGVFRRDAEVSNRAPENTEGSGFGAVQALRDSGLLKRLNSAEVFRPFGDRIMEFAGKMLDTDCVLLGSHAEAYFSRSGAYSDYANDTSPGFTWEFNVGGGERAFVDFTEFLTSRGVEWDNNGARRSEEVQIGELRATVELVEGTCRSGPVIAMMAPQSGHTRSGPHDNDDEVRVIGEVEGEGIGHAVVSGWGSLLVTPEGSMVVYPLWSYINVPGDYDVGPEYAMYIEEPSLRPKADMAMSLRGDSLVNYGRVTYPATMSFGGSDGKPVVHHVSSFFEGDTVVKSEWSLDFMLTLDRAARERVDAP